MQALRRAAEILGGPLELRGYLKVSALVLTLWMSGACATPTEIFLKVVDLIVERDVSDLKSKHG
jgi:hypothetical protein